VKAHLFKTDDLTLNKQLQDGLKGKQQGFNTLRLALSCTGEKATMVERRKDNLKCNEMRPCPEEWYI
jgi:hypothetical protein